MTEKEQKEIFSKNLVRMIKARNKQQIEVAKAIGVSQQTFNNWCRGVALPRIGKIEELARYFNCSKADLIDPEPIRITPYHSELGTAPTAPRTIVAKGLYVSDKPIEIQERKALGDMHASITQVVDTLKEKIDQEVKKYYSEETLETAQALFENEDMRLLFDAAQGCTPADLKMAADLLKRLKGTNPDG